MPDLDLGSITLLIGAAIIAGAVNAVAGGGSLISFPALLAVGYPSLTANVTNIVAVLPGYLGGSLAYRRELRGQRGRFLALGATGAVGALVGAGLLVAGPESLFEQIVPFLILAACALLAVQPLAQRVMRLDRAGREHRSTALHVLVFLAAVYGGYFGAALGIMLLALLGLHLEEDLQRVNALKGLLSLVIGLVSAVYLALAGPVVWAAAGIMAGGTLVGGHAGVAVARRLPAAVLRGLVIAYGVSVAVLLIVEG